MPSFFNVPAELRYMIYDCLWRETPSIRLCLVPGLRHFAEYDGPLKKDQKFTIGLPIWLLASKTFRLEGIDQFHTIGRSNVTLDANSSAGNGCFRFLADENIYDRELFSPALTPYNSRRKCLDLQDWQTRWSNDPPKLIILDGSSNSFATTYHIDLEPLADLVSRVG
jgi:hypothetical protein